MSNTVHVLIPVGKALAHQAHAPRAIRSGNAAVVIGLLDNHKRNTDKLRHFFKAKTNRVDWAMYP